MFKEERAAGVKEITGLRKKVAQELDRKKIEAEAEAMSAIENADAGKPKHDDGPKDEAPMEVDDTPVPTVVQEKKPAPEVKEESTATMQADDDDAVEY